MAIYHLSAQVISRSKGQSAVAAAAYRSGERLIDERTGETKCYQREVQPETMILAPSNSPEWVQDRQQLWNEVEKSETRKNSQVAREINIALPRELSDSEQTKLIRGYVQKEFVDQGMIADVAIHRDDKENPHAHVMLTTREISKEGFTVKNRDWNKKEGLMEWREQWANQANQALERQGIQERITHESHQTRNLIIFPTVHLGHVAHEMEHRGIQTNRGNINRDVQKYNGLVVNLQKYREEKQAWEQEQTRQQEQKQKKETFYTAAELVDLQEASKIVKSEPTQENMNERRKQLDEGENKANVRVQELRWKEGEIREVLDHFRWTDTYKNQIQEAQQRMDQLNWFNPLKIKNNQQVKEQAEQALSYAKKQLHLQENKLNDYREKLGFKTEKEFTQVKDHYEMDTPVRLEKIRNARQLIAFEREVFQKAEKALENAVVRQVTSHYPERPEMRYMSFKTAKTLQKFNEKHREIVPIEKIQQIVNIGRTEIKALQDKIHQVEQDKARLQRVEGYMKKYEKHQLIVEQMENTPFSKGKRLVSKSAKQAYHHAVSARDQYQDLMKEEGVTGREDVKKQRDVVSKMESNVPALQSKVQIYEKSTNLLAGIIQGIEQASQEMLSVQKRQKREKQKTKGKSKSSTPSWELGE